ncbi:ribonuclease H-like domain-containing protein [Tanacetum coccineum]
MSCHVTTTSPLPRSHVHALRDPNWKEAMLDEYNALITNRTCGVRSMGLNMPHVPGLRLRTASGMFLSQSKFAVETLDRANMQKCNPCKTPVCLYMHDPRDPHFTALKRILRYVHGTIDHGLELHVSSTAQLTAYTDANWAGCPVTRRSTFGYCVFFSDNLLSWSAKRHVTLSRSSAEQDNEVANVVARDFVLRNLLLELHAPLSTATIYT